MIKLLQAATLGGAPITKADLRILFQLELWDVIEGFFSAQFGADVQGVILSGCAVTANAGNFDMSAGIVFLNGQFMRVPAVTNQAFTKYIQPGTVVNDSRTFADASVQAVMATTPAVCQAGVPGSGQYITISSLTSADAQRWGKVLDLLTSTNIIRGLSANQGSILAGRDLSWVVVNITATDLDNGVGAVNPTTGSGKIYYRRSAKETFVSIYFVCSFAAIPTAVRIKNIPANLEAVLLADPLQAFPGEYMGSTGNNGGGKVASVSRPIANTLQIVPATAWGSATSIQFYMNTVIQG